MSKDWNGINERAAAPQAATVSDDRLIDLVVEYAPKHEFRDPEDGLPCFSALGFARDLANALAAETPTLSEDVLMQAIADTAARGHVWASRALSSFRAKAKP